MASYEGIVEGNILLWYLHPDQSIQDKLFELLSLVRSDIIIRRIDPLVKNGGLPSIFDYIKQSHNSRSGNGN